MVAALLIGLRDDSRIKMKISGRRITLDQELAAGTLDALRYLCWTKSEHKSKRYTEKSVLEHLTNPPQKDEYEIFDSVEEFETYMKSFEA